MPQTIIRLFRQANRQVPLLNWLNDLEKRDPRGFEKCLERILSLESFGHELRRPLADALRDGIRELRVRAGNVQHRMLYFFSGKNQAVLSHGLTKEGKVDDAEIDKALKHKKLVDSDLDRYTADWVEDEDQGNDNG